MMNYNHLYYFYVAAKTGGMTNAAKVLKISQPALSFQIRTLEESINRKLFQKSGRKVILTRDGVDLFRYSEKMFDIANEMLEHLNEQAQTGKSRVRIGVTANIERPFVTQAIASALKRERRGSLPFVGMESGRHLDLLEKLRLKQIDLLLTDQIHTDFDLTTLLTLDFPVFLLRKKKQSEGVSKITVKSLLNQPGVGLVLPSPRSLLRREIDFFLDGIGSRVATVFESDILASVSRAIVEGLGVGFLPVQYLAHELACQTVEKLGPPGGLWQHRFYVVGNRKRQVSPIEKGILNALKGPLNLL